MFESWQNSDYEYLKGKRPTEKQLRHLSEDLFYSGPNITDAYEASQLIDILRADPMVRVKREYRDRIKNGPSWLAWEKWMTHVSRKEHDKESWLEWWRHTKELAIKANEPPPEEPPLPVWCQGGTYNTPGYLFTEIREVFGIPDGGQFALELSAATREEALLAKEQIKVFREKLMVIDDDCQWMLARIREGALDKEELLDLFQECSGLVDRPNTSAALNEVKKYFVNSYGIIRSIIKNLKSQMTEFRRKSKEVYRV